ncbi:MAG: hypothetical protein QM713_00085 [Arachnia sp.]
MTDVRIEDVLDGYADLGHWNAVAAEFEATIRARDVAGRATIDIYGTSPANPPKKHEERPEDLREGDIYVFPSESRSALDEVATFGSLDELATKIDVIIKNKAAAPAARPARAARAAPAARRPPARGREPT